MNIRQSVQSLSEIFIVVLSVFAFSYIISESFPAVTAAEGNDWMCCSKTIEGALCQDVALSSMCAEGETLTPTKCSETYSCKQGCCIDTIEGTYDPKVPQVLCTGANSDWIEDANCNVAGADYGCCILGSSTAYTTSQRCSYLSDQKGFDKEYYSDMDEASCVALSELQFNGACILSEDSCKFTSESECIQITGKSGTFYQNMLCTAPLFNNSCEPTKETTCVDGKDEVYFLDSCGNQANIYDAEQFDNETYWTYVFQRGASCNPLSSNADSKDCGSCNRYLGSTCESASENFLSPTMGDYYCKDLSCEFEGKNYKNGESWCAYDGKIGDGDDIVGSRHWRYTCSNGEVQVEPCADARGEICVQQDVATGLTSATCRANNWQECIALNKEKNKSATICNSILDCEQKTVTIDKFTASLCTPQYPEGFEFDETNQKTAKSVCSLATKTCVVKYKKPTPFSPCKCVENCDCEEAIFTQQMNDLCTSLGDCGGYVNVAGKMTSGGYQVSEAPKVTYNYKNFSDPKNYPYQYAGIGNVSDKIEQAGINANTSSNIVGASGVQLNAYYNELAQALAKSNPSLVTGNAIAPITGMAYIENYNDVPGGIWAGGTKADTIASLTSSGQSATSVVAAQQLAPSLTYFEPTSALNSYLSGDTFFNPLGLSEASVVATPLAGFIGAAIVGIAAGIIGGYLAKALGLSPIGSMLFSAGFSMIAMVGVNSYIFPIPLPFDPATMLIVGVVLIIASLFFGGADCPPVIVTYTCDTWKQPVGGADCELMNDDPLKPISEYRCHTLGSTCEIVNAGTTSEMCSSASANDATAPSVGPQIGTISDDEQYSDVTENGFSLTTLDGECLEAYKTIYFGVQTSEPAICKFDLTQKTFDEMQFYVGEGVYSYNHTAPLTLPDPSHGQSQGSNWTGDLSLYILCQDRYGNTMPQYYTVDMCVNQADDITAPKVTATYPANEGLVAYNITSKQIEIYTNEPSECKWSTTDTTYEKMTNQMSCANNILTDMTALGFKCNATVPVINATNIYYIKCQDQPWLVGENATNRVAMSESYEYTLSKPSSKLAIAKVAPQEEVEVDSNPSTVNLQIETSGGAANPVCYYKYGNSYIRFLESGARYHKQPLQLSPGKYSFPIKCEDSTEDLVESKIEFQVYKDSTIPLISRVFNSGEQMTIYTSEEASCVYSQKSCAYNFDNATSIGTGTEMSFSITKGEIYYVKCKDEKNNIPSGCSIVLQAT